MISLLEDSSSEDEEELDMPQALHGSGTDVPQAPHGAAPGSDHQEADRPSPGSEGEAEAPPSPREHRHLQVQYHRCSTHPRTGLLYKSGATVTRKNYFCWM